MSDHQELNDGSSQAFNAEANDSSLAYPVEAQDLITFRVGRQFYALPVSNILQIVSMVSVTPFPTPVGKALLGMINVHGTVVPVADMRKHLGVADSQLGLYTPIILVYSQKKLLGLVVDEVADVIHLTGDQLVPLAGIFPDGTACSSILSWLANVNDRLIPVISSDFLFSELLTPEQSGSLTNIFDRIPMVPPVNPDDGQGLTPALQPVLRSPEAPATPANGNGQVHNLDVLDGSDQGQD